MRTEANSTGHQNGNARARLRGGGPHVDAPRGQPPSEREQPGPEHAARFVELLTSHQPKLYAYICTLLVGDSSASDVLQDTNIDLWSRAAEFDFERPFLPWAFAFARQRVMAFRKTQSRSRLLFGDAAMQRIDLQCTQLAAEADVRLAALQRCLQKLPPKQATLVKERYQGRSSVKLIAARLGETAQNIASQLYRIRKALAGCVDASLTAEERS
ncbi:MAG: sigma-70 family RNA polymerase sigma factor [Planctomycetales bacterium]|nr:sigma-70 family RNA polymerase sigma factor [Planctomycetales bacterium]